MPISSQLWHPSDDENHILGCSFLLSSGTPLIEEELARKEEVPVKKSKIWPLR